MNAIRPQEKDRKGLWLFLSATALGAYYFLVSTPVILDDVFIYFRIDGNMVKTGKPVFNAGDNHFAATSGLWTMLLAIHTCVFTALGIVP
jgi:hypothetical protein